MGGLLNLPDGWTGDAHNLYLELVAETGVIGFLVFAFLIVYALRAAILRFRNAQNEFDSLISLAVFAAICGVLVHGTVDYLFHTAPQVTALFFLILGLLSAHASRHENDPAPSSSKQAAS